MHMSRKNFIHQLTVSNKTVPITHVVAVRFAHCIGVSYWNSFVAHCTQIKHCQARIHRIHEFGIGSAQLQSVSSVLDEQYNIGKSQHKPINLDGFICKNTWMIQH